jgi:pimeloyl-ACP methyl ester carboxylesterase
LDANRVTVRYSFSSGFREMRVKALLISVVAAVCAALMFRWLFRKREDIDWGQAPRPGQLLDVDGVRIHYVEQGSGPVVLLIHGFGGHTYSFRHTMPALASAGFRAVALDLKGFGYSERVKGGDYRLSSQARMVLRFMDTLAIERASLVGHSMGGEVAMRVAAAAPERVERLVLAASVSGDRVPTLPPTPLLKRFLPLIARALGRRLFRRSFYDRSRASDDVYEQYRLPGRVRGTMDGLYEIFRDMRKDDRLEHSRIKQPVLILWAEGERVLPRWILRRLCKRLPQAEVVTVPRSGHLLLEERPEECNAAILRFLGARAPLKDEATVTQPAGSG